MPSTTFSRRPWRSLTALAVLVLITALAMSRAMTVRATVNPTSPLVLQGSVYTGSGTSCNSNTSPGPWDWCSLFTVSSSGTVTPNSPLPAGFISAAFTPDYATPDLSYINANKDGTDMSSWTCSSANSPLGKDDIINGMAATNSANSQFTVYAGQERGSNNGDSDAGFWFLQAKSLPCSSLGTAGAAHTDGDILVTADYTGGGTTATPCVFLWNHTVSGNLQLLTTTESATCGGVIVPGSPPFTSGGCASSFDVCSISNSSAFTPPWPSPKSDSKAGKPDNVDDTNEFVEMGLDLSAIFAGANPPCFSSFVFETRTSQSTSADLKDATFGNFSVCATITAHKYLDANANGTLDTGEPGLAGWTFNLYADSSGHPIDTGAGSPVATGPTDANGNVVFTNVTASVAGTTYWVCETIQTATPAWNNSDPGTTVTGTSGATLTCKSVTANFGSVNTVNLGNYQNATVSGTKTNANGGAGLSGWTIGLYTGCATSCTLVVSTATGLNGAYSLQVKPGTYDLCETPQADWVEATPSTDAASGGCNDIGGTNASQGNGVDGAKVTNNGYGLPLTPGQTSSGNNFANKQLRRLIVIACDEVNDALVGATTSTGTTITSVPSGLPATTTAAELCSAASGDLGSTGAVDSGLAPGAQSTGITVTNIP